MFPYCTIYCPNCKISSIAQEGRKGVHNDAAITSRGWAKNPRIVYGPKDRIIVFTRMYQCKCKKLISSADPAVLEKFPFEVQKAFPFVFSHRCGIEVSMLRSMVSSIESSTGIAAFRKMIREAYKLNYQEKELSYLSTIASLDAERKNSQPSAVEKNWNTSEYLRNTLPEFSKFEDANGYFGQVPSGKF